MATAVVVMVGLLAALALLLWTVHQLRPARFHIRASVAKLVSLDVQMDASPSIGERPPIQILQPQPATIGTPSADAVPQGSETRIETYAEPSPGHPDQPSWSGGEPARGLEPLTPRLQGECSAD